MSLPCNSLIARCTLLDAQLGAMTIPICSAATVLGHAAQGQSLTDALWRALRARTKIGRHHRAVFHGASFDAGDELNATKQRTQFAQRRL